MAAPTFTENWFNAWSNLLSEEGTLSQASRVRQQWLEDYLQAMQTLTDGMSLINRQQQQVAEKILTSYSTAWSQKMPQNPTIWWQQQTTAMAETTKQTMTARDEMCRMLYKSRLDATQTLTRAWQQAVTDLTTTYLTAWPTATLAATITTPASQQAPTAWATPTAAKATATKAPQAQETPTSLATTKTTEKAQKKSKTTKTKSASTKTSTPRTASSSPRTSSAASSMARRASASRRVGRR